MSEKWPNPPAPWSAPSSMSRRFRTSRQRSPVHRLRLARARREDRRHNFRFDRRHHRAGHKTVLRRAEYPLQLYRRRWRRQHLDRLGRSEIHSFAGGRTEFRVINSSYSVEFGRAVGGIVNIITKSGTNNFHGSVYEYFRNDKLDAGSILASSDPSTCNTPGDLSHLEAATS